MVHYHSTTLLELFPVTFTKLKYSISAGIFRQAIKERFTKHYRNLSKYIRELTYQYFCKQTKYELTLKNSKFISIVFPDTNFEYDMKNAVQ